MPSSSRSVALLPRSALQRFLTKGPIAVDGPTRSALVDAGKVKTFGRWKLLYTQGAPAEDVLVLGQGQVQLLRTLPGGHEMGLGIRDPGEWCGEETIAAPIGAVYHERAEAMTEVEVLAIPYVVVHRLFMDGGEFAASMAIHLFRQRAALEARLAAALYTTVEARLAGFLLEASERWGVPKAEGGRLIASPLTHADIAGLIGTMRTTVTTMLGQFRVDGLIRFDGRRVVVIEPAVLRKMSGR